MRWPFRRRAKTDIVFVGGAPWEQPQSSGVTLVAAPADAASPTTPAVPDSVVPPAPTVAVTHGDDVEQLASRGRHEVRRPEAVDPGVRLGFADGSILMLPDDDPTATALREAAARLTAAADPQRTRRL